jgi:hypothetical protein
VGGRQAGVAPMGFSSPIVALAMLKITLHNSPPHARARSHYAVFAKKRAWPRLAARTL